MALFTCDEFDWGDGVTKRFLRVDYSHDCSTSEHKLNVLVATIFAMLYGIGVSAVLLGRGSRGSVLAQATSKTTNKSPAMWHDAFRIMSQHSTRWYIANTSSPSAALPQPIRYGISPPPPRVALRTRKESVGTAREMGDGSDTA